MKRDLSTELEKSELEDTLEGLKIDIRLTKATLLFFILISLFFRVYTAANFSFAIPIILFVWLSIYFVNERLIKKMQSSEEVYSFYFRSLILEAFLLTLIIHFLGGIEWIGGFFYILIISLGSVVLPKKKTMALVLMVSLFYVSLVSLEFFQIIPHHNLFLEQQGIDLYTNPVYLIITTITLIAFIFFSADMIGSFSENLRDKRRKLIKAQEEVNEAFQEVEEAKNVLEVRVAARTRELEALTGNLEEQVKERTKELEKKIKELEKVNRLMVGREMKMIELKKEIKKSKGKKK